MKLHHFPLSSNARKAVLTAKLLGSPVQLVVCDLTKGEQKRPEFLALNPNGKVPVLEDGSFKLSESHAIMQYLCDKQPGNPLYPTDIKARADIHRWMFWGSNHWSPAIAGLSFENVLKKRFGLGDPDPGQVKRHEAAFHELARVLDAHLANRTWVSGDTLTLADVALGTPLMVAGPAKLPLDGCLDVKRWFAAIQELDAWKQTEPAPVG